MTSSTLNEWNIAPDAETLAYHDRQREAYASTVQFGKFIAPYMHDAKRVFDMGCGAGYPTNYLARTFPKVKMFGLDQSEILIAAARLNCKQVEKFYVEDITNLSTTYHRIDGVVSLQTFSWMPDIETPLHQIGTKIRPSWLVFSSLFYNGEISTQCIVNEPTRPRKSYYNVYSIPETRRILSSYGYKMANSWRFNITEDIPKPDNPDLMKTYTQRTGDGFRNQFSGPLYLPWYFLAFERII